MPRHLLNRVLILIGIVAAAIVLNLNASAAETFFCALIGTVGAAAFLFVRPSVSFAERFKMIGVWDMMMPVIVVVYLIYSDPAQMDRYVVWLVFLAIFVVGVGAGLKLLISQKKR